MKKLFLTKRLVVAFLMLIVIIICIIFTICKFAKKSNPLTENNNNNNIPLYNKTNNEIVKPEQKYIEIINKDFELNKYLKKYIDKSETFSIDIDYIENNIIYGSVLNTKEDSILFTTICLFQYNLNTKVYKEYKYNNGRIFDYYIDGKNIYYVSEEIKNNAYSWKLNKSTLTFKDNKILDFGNIDNDMNSPRLLKDNINNAIYVFTLKNNGEIQTSDFYKINGEHLELLETFFGNHSSKKGSFIYEMLFLTINKGKVYYIKVDDYATNSLIEYDVISRKNQVLKEDSINNYYQEFFVTDLGIFMNSQSESGINNYFKKVEDKEFKQLENYNKEFYFGRKLNENIILFIDGSQWYSLNIDDLKISSGPKYEEQYPNYFILNNNQILYQKFNHNWYIGELK